MELTEAQRAALLTRAVEAIGEHFRLSLLADDRTKVTAAQELAELAVTDAVTRGGLAHTHIAKQASCAALHVAALITDLDAAGRALGDERRAARDYTDKVRAAIQRHAAKVAATSDRGTVTRAADHLGATRKAVYDWAEGVDAADLTDRELFHRALVILTRSGATSANNEQLQQGFRVSVTDQGMAFRVRHCVDNLHPGEVTTAEMNDLVTAYVRALNVLDEPSGPGKLRRLKDLIRQHHGEPDGLRT